MLKQWIVLLLTTTLALSACNSPVYNQTQSNVADVKIKSDDMLRKSDADAKPKPSLLVKDGSYVDTSPIDLDKNPNWLDSHIVIRGDQLPFSYYSRVIASGAGKNLLTKFQVGLDSGEKVSINYSGPVRGALDLLASKSGYVYTVHANAVYWQAFVTKTFDIAFMPGDTDYLMGKSSGSGSGTSAQGGTSGGASNYTTSDYSDAEYSNLSAKLSVWKDLDASIKEMLSPQGRVTVSQATTTVMVRDRPTNVALIGQYIQNLNAHLSKQVLVKVQILEVDLSNDFNFGINWAIVSRAFNKSPFQLSGNYGTPIVMTSTLSGGAVPTVGLNPALNPPISGGPAASAVNGVPNYQVLINALNQQGKASLVSEPRVVCLNNQVSVVRIVRQEGYAASIQNTSGTGGSGTVAQNTVTSQITPGSVVTGLTLYVLPKIMKDKVFLQVNADLSANNGFTTFGPTISNTTSAQIQLPNITEKHFNQRSMIRSGDTLIMSGFRQVGNQANAMQFLESQTLGGKASQEVNRETIILITPIVLEGTA